MRGRPNIENGLYAKLSLIHNTTFIEESFERIAAAEKNLKYENDYFHGIIGSSFTACHSCAGARGWSGESIYLRPLQLYEVRIPDRHARRRQIMHGGLCAQGRQPALPDPAAPDALLGEAVRQQQL